MGAFDLIDPFRTMYPDKEDFTYAPFGTLRKTRSRLDFFIMSQSLLCNHFEIEHVPGRLCKLFDHKCIKISFTPDPVNVKKNKSMHIKNSVLNKKSLSLSVTLEAKKVLINVLSQPTYSRFRDEQKNLLNESKAICNNVGKKFGELKKVIISIANGKNFNELHRERLLDEIETLLETVPDTNELWRGLDPEHYNKNFENLLTGMRTAALRWQKLLVRAQNLEITNLKNKIKGVNTRSEEYIILENILISKQDNKLREQLLDSKLSEVLGSEKPSRHFLDIAKVTSSDESLTVIKKGDGSKTGRIGSLL
jgi:hypothetical protein